MGGNAFNQMLPQATFPRMSPAVYRALKVTLLPLVQSQYELVAIPPEAPGKADHGDLDFVVSRPRPGTSSETVKEVLKARYSLPQEGNRMSNYAVPLHILEVGVDPESDPGDHAAEQETYFQVDVNVYANEYQWELACCLSSYGDLGIILNHLARKAGLIFNAHGLKLANPLPTSPPVTYYLSSSLSDILAFFGLSKTRWLDGFTTQQEIFDWIATSPLFLAVTEVQSTASSALNSSARRILGSRNMYVDFLEYARAHAMRLAQPSETKPLHSAGPRSVEVAVTQDDALRFFGKEAEHAALLRASRIKQRVKETFSGKAIEKYTGLYGLPVKWAVDTMREKLVQRAAHTEVLSLDDARLLQHSTNTDGEQRGQPVPTVSPWEITASEMSEDDIRSFALQVKQEMEIAGTFELNWEKEIARKAEKQKLKELEGK